MGFVLLGWFIAFDVHSTRSRFQPDLTPESFRAGHFDFVPSTGLRNANHGFGDLFTVGASLKLVALVLESQHIGIFWMIVFVTHPQILLFDFFRHKRF